MQKAIQKVGYSVAMRQNPINNEAAPKAYGTLQINGVIDIYSLGRHMSEHNSKYSRGDIVSVLIQLTDCMREMFIQGFKIQLGDLGSFTPTISTEGAETMEKFTEANIKEMNITFQPGPYLKNLADEADFEYRATRVAQLATAKAEKAGLDNVDLGAAKAK